jgi:hypothetical protein
VLIFGSGEKENMAAAFARAAGHVAPQGGRHAGPHGAAEVAHHQSVEDFHRLPNTRGRTIKRAPVPVRVAMQ